MTNQHGNDRTRERQVLSGGLSDLVLVLLRPGVGLFAGLGTLFNKAWAAGKACEAGGGLEIQAGRILRAKTE